jgi:cysteine-rich CPXCG protein
MEIVVIAEIVCPKCGEVFSVQIDTSETEQSFIEDCAVCCRPIQLSVCCRPGEIVDLTIST